MINLIALKSGLGGIVSAVLASSCCLGPFALISLGVGGGGLMGLMRYQTVFIPAGMVLLGVSYYLYFREKKRCAAKGCRVLGKTFNLIMLVLSTLIVLTAVGFNIWVM